MQGNTNRSHTLDINNRAGAGLIQQRAPPIMYVPLTKTTGGGRPEPEHATSDGGDDDQRAGTYRGQSERRTRRAGPAPVVPAALPPAAAPRTRPASTSRYEHPGRGRAQQAPAVRKARIDTQEAVTW